MGSSAKKKREKKADFQKPKLKVGKARPKNTNATDTSFSSKSIILKQQNLSESGRDSSALFNHNLSLLSSKNDTQRRDALQYLTTVCAATTKSDLPQPASAIVAKAQSLILDGSNGVRSQVLKLFKALPTNDFGPLDQLVIYVRAGMTHLSSDIRLSALDVLDWLLVSKGTAVMATPGGWVKMLRTFQNLLSWQSQNGKVASAQGGSWTATKTGSGNLGSSKLLVHQITTLSTFLTVGLTLPAADPHAAAKRASMCFPLYQMHAHMLPSRSNAFGYLNLFGAVRDQESEGYDDADERIAVFNELGLLDAFRSGAKEAKQEAGEVGRAASNLEKALKLADVG
ncbi:hypothetical protein BAUCODRAFT_73335 [Baudoinia panamericana UAMH 10762]|uniref:Pre-rRNA-processing protein n=1 Tax=Baudoinia panamericana (strain UAMH 10762) TaxID=717646 RepID=M2N5Q2_BAUPA|nr:uncharacterized protein BAUCODRAFT_73335 [Baudoinia panamericana UAMH 10762]EMC94369.1 hypothetical protein BAUCODRAFT_73335 [Baudoinia panamericana UAMH 10762]